jgi:hypothetical protein
VRQHLLEVIVLPLCERAVAPRELGRYAVVLLPVLDSQHAKPASKQQNNDGRLTWGHTYTRCDLAA